MLKKWANKLFGRKKQDKAPPPEPVKVAPPVAEDVPAARRSSYVLSTFLEAVTKFGYEDFFTRETSPSPHLLQAETMARDNYLHQFFSAASDILRGSYQDSKSYRAEPDYTWEHLFPEVSDFLRAQEPETAAAFQTLLKYCKKYEKSVADMEPELTGGRTITFAKNGISNAEAAELKDALEKIWKAAPNTDPRLIEGMEYVMESRPQVGAAFPNYWWTKSRDRSDAEIAKKLESKTLSGGIFSQNLSYEQAAAIAQQTADNLAALKPHAQEIAETTLAWCLSRTLDIDDDWRILDASRKAARGILGALAAGSTVQEQAQDIRDGKYGPLGGKDGDDQRQRAIQSAASASQFLAVAQEVNSGAWFDTERARLLQLATEARLTPEQRAAKERERRQQQVREIGRDATVLQSPVKVSPRFQLKPPGG